MSQPKKVVFIHIPKTAGTSIVGLLEANYPKKHRRAIYSLEYLDRELQKALEDPMIHCIYGHFPLRPVIAQSDAFVFTVLRDPVQRSISHYNHYMSGHEPRHREVFAHVKSPEDFGKMVHSYNLQSVHFSGLRNVNREILPDDLVWEHAMANLDRFNAVGFTEHYPESVACFGALLGWHTTEVAYLNIGKRKETGSRAVWEAMNEWDLKLYEICKEKFLPEVMRYKDIAPRASWKYKLKSYLRGLSSKF